MCHREKHVRNKAGFSLNLLYPDADIIGHFFQGGNREPADRVTHEIPQMAR
jgi:hypothetical protein